MKSIRYIMYFVDEHDNEFARTENAQAVAQGENKIDEKVRQYD